MLTICTEISVQNFRQMILVFLLAPKNRNRIELYPLCHLQNAGKVFAFTGHEARNWQSKQMVHKLSVVLVKMGKR